MICGRSIKGDQSKKKHDHRGCSGSNPLVEDLIVDPKRHQLYGFIMEGRNSALLSCKLCGAWTTKKPVRLARVCTRSYTVASTRESGKIWNELKHPLDPEVCLRSPVPISALEGRVKDWLIGSGSK